MASPDAAPQHGRRAGLSHGGAAGYPYASSLLSASGLDKAQPGWRLPTKARPENSELMESRCELRKGLADFYSSTGPALHGGIRTFQAKFGQEAGWKNGLKLVPPPLRVDAAAGKRLGYSPPDQGEVRAPQRAHFPTAPSGHQTKLFQSMGHPHDPEGLGLASGRRSKEANAESMMTRKRITHTLGQQRNGCPLATLGDKAYADPTYSAGYWKDAAYSNWKCGEAKLLRKRRPPNLPKLRDAEARLRADVAEVEHMPSLPQGAPRYELRVKLPRKELDDIAARFLNYDAGEVSILKPPSDAAAAIFAQVGITKGHGDRGDPQGYVRSEFPVCLLRLNGEEVCSEETVAAALKRAPAGDVEICVGHDTGDAGLDSD
eukprot:TRINITY_DN60157_c0_g1_i1.p2 TRINITY_DN60157_c0_g1~~TRINITY_DN60157_c0_g1_i1.p2  ORF type:complete len:408 (+),score=130.61 TRINITY_DN60157_c0_g1_i1:100-1224(+)